MRTKHFSGGRVVRVIILMLTALALTGTGQAYAGSMQYHDGWINPGEEIGSGSFSGCNGGCKITRSSGRNTGGSGVLCVNARNNDNGLLVGSWVCTGTFNGLAEHSYCGCISRSAVGDEHDHRYRVGARLLDEWA